jgi:Flp pilus assembly protein TadG
MKPQSPVTSFAEFTIGFFVFISLSFGLTYAVTTYTNSQQAAQQAAAARAALMGAATTTAR